MYLEYTLLDLPEFLMRQERVKAGMMYQSLCSPPRA